jgi:hypothetical protein
MRLGVAENSVGSIPSAISMPDSHVLPSLQAQAGRTPGAAIGCQDENDAADRRQEIEESLRKEVSRIFTSWNQMMSWLRQLEGLRRAA